MRHAQVSPAWLVAASILVACENRPVSPGENCSAPQVAATSSEQALLGRRLPLTAVVFSDSVKNGAQDAGILDVPITWHSRNETVLRIVGESAEARVAGVATIVASACGWHDSLSVEVIPAGYQLTFLGDDVGAQSAAVAINESGEVVGRAMVAGELRNFLWRAGVVTDLGGCSPLDINNSGQVLCVGNGPTIWQQGAISVLDTIIGQARAINDSGHVAIHRADGTVLRWRTPSNIDTLLGSAAFIGTMNRSGVISGALSSLYPTGALWTGKQYRNTGGFGRYSYVNAVNDSSDAVGYSEAMSPYGKTTVAVLSRRETDWAAESFRRGFPLKNPVAAAASDINDRLEVVGEGTGGGFVWRNSRLAFLSDIVSPSGWSITNAPGINERGQIIAHGQNAAASQVGAVLLTPP